MSDSPIVFGSKFQHRLVELNRAKTMPEKLAAFSGFSFGELVPVAPSTQEPRTGLSMGEHCELMAREWDITREAQDELALRSHQNATRAYDEGFHDDLLVPFAGVLERQQRSRRHDSRKDGRDEAGLRQEFGEGNADRCQLDAAHRWCIRGTPR